MGVAMSDVQIALEGESGRLEGWPAITAGLRQLLIEAFTQKARRVVVLDLDFVQWPWSDPELLHHMAQWGRLGRRLEMLAPSYAACARRHPRFFQWRQHFDHLLQIGSFEPREVGPDWPACLMAAADGPVLRVLEFEHGRATWARSGPHAAAERHAVFEFFDGISQRSEPAWPYTELGL